MHSINSVRLRNVVELLVARQSEIDNYFYAYIFTPYRVDIENCFVGQNLEAAKRLLDFSFTTRQGGQNSSAIQNYEIKKEEVMERLEATLHVLKSDDFNARKRYEIGLALINGIEGIGQKIASMFLKFIIYYSKDFPTKREMVRELFIPFDSHVLKLLFTGINGESTNRLNLYDEAINQSALQYDIKSAAPLVLKNTRLLKLQSNIREDFDELNLEEPPIILDYLWYVGSMYCSARFGDIGCKVCFLQEDCDFHRSAM
jgi:hypothetical protein